MRATRIALAALLAAALVAGCHSTKSARRFTKAEIASSLARLEKTGLEIGVFPIEGATSIIDGDTIRVRSLRNSLRLIGVDTEETFKKAWEREAFAAGFEAYKKKIRGDSKRPVKMATPVGEEAKHWAQEFFARASEVKLERDHPGEIRDFYGRYLAYVFVQRDGKWVNYNIEAVRAGMSPYFVKYAYSRRFDKEFREAEAEARAAQIGIWDPKKQHYDDYEERLAWWHARGKTIREFEEEMATHSNYFALTRWDSLKKLEEHVGREVVLLGSVGAIKLGEKGPTVVKLSRSRTSDFELIFFDKDVYLASNIASASSEYVRVRGVVQKYKDKFRKTDKLQMVIHLPSQVALPGQPLRDAPLRVVPPPPPIAGSDAVEPQPAPEKVRPEPASAQPAEAAGADADAVQGGAAADESPEYKDMDFGDLDLMDNPDAHADEPD